MRTFYLGSSFFLVSAILFSGCATLIGGGSNQKVRIHSVPTLAYFEVKSENGMRVAWGKTPQTLELTRGKDYQVSISMEGFRTTNLVLSKDLNKWVWGNFLFSPFCILGFAIDFISGSVYKIDLSSINTNLANSAAGRAGVIVVRLIEKKGDTLAETKLMLQLPESKKLLPEELRFIIGNQVRVWVSEGVKYKGFTYKGSNWLEGSVADVGPSALAIRMKLGGGMVRIPFNLVTELQMRRSYDQKWVKQLLRFGHQIRIRAFAGIKYYKKYEDIFGDGGSEGIEGSRFILHNGGIWLEGSAAGISSGAIAIKMEGGGGIVRIPFRFIFELQARKSNGEAWSPIWADDALALSKELGVGK